MILYVNFFRILETVSISYQKHFDPKDICYGVVAALVLENQNHTEDIFETVILTVGSKFNNDQKCEYKKDGCTWALCDCHAEALCYQLSGLYMLTEIYKLHKKLSSIFDKISDSGYKLKNGIRFHLFTSYHPCGFMADGKKSFLSWKTEFTGMPHILECSSKILIGAYLGIQGPLSSLLVQRVFISSVIILHDKKSKKKDLLREDGIRKCFDDFSGKLNRDSKECFHAPTIYIIDEDLDNITKIFQYPVPPRSRGYQKNEKIGFVFPDVLKVYGQEKWVRNFQKTDFYDVGKEIEKYYQYLKSKLSLSSLLRSTTTTELLNNIETLTLTLEVSTSVQNAVKEQTKKNIDHLEKVKYLAGEVDSSIFMLKKKKNTDLQFLCKNDMHDKKTRERQKMLSIYCPKETDSGCDEDGKDAVNKDTREHLLKKANAFTKEISLLTDIQKEYEYFLNNQCQLTLTDVDCDWGRYIKFIKEMYD